MNHSLVPHDAPAAALLAACLGALDGTWSSRRGLFMGVALLLLAGAGLSARFGRRAWNALERRLHGPSVVSTERVLDDGTYRNLIFLHHSTGAYLILQGDVRRQFTRKGYQFWDHDYNQDGLTRPDGKLTHTHYAIPDLSPGDEGGGNTDPEGLAQLFAQPVHNPPDNAFSRLLQHPVVIFKSCFPNNALKSEAMLERHQALYLGMRDSMDRHPRHLFILLTTPPLHPLATTPEEASRARRLSQWLQSDTFKGGHPNLQVFDFYNLLADSSTNMLRTEYWPTDRPKDSHPNALANKYVGPLFVDFVDKAIGAFRSSAHPVEAEPAP